MSIEWNQDKSDYSWSVTDRDGYFYRVNRVFVADPHYPANLIKVWVTAWSEKYPVYGLRIGTHSYATADDAKSAMGNIMSSEEEVAA